MSSVLDTTFLDRFSSEGRLKREWAHALAASDAGTMMAGLRAVRDRLVHDPERFAGFWPSFLDCVLEPARARLLSDDDLAALEAMADRTGEAADTWSRLVSVRTDRGQEREARALLTKICEHRSTAPELRAESCRELARRGASGDAQLLLYVEHLSVAADPTAEEEVSTVLGRLLAVDLESDDVRLRRAHEAAWLLVEHGLELPRTHTALGLGALLLEEEPEKATAELEAALAADSRDTVAAVGLACALLRGGDYDRAGELATKVDPSSDPALPELLLLATTLSWLNGRGAGPAPASASSLLDSMAAKYAPDAFAEAVGRLHLIEGNADEARMLIPLAGQHPERPELSYYAAWAALLTGDPDGVERCVEQSAGRAWEWTTVCVLLDVDPAKAVEHPKFAEPKGPYKQVVVVRRGMAQSLPPSAVAPKKRSGWLPDELETLRTMLGRALYVGDRVVRREALASPLFARLPWADAMLWRGLDALANDDRAGARGLLEQAALRGGHPRAALALATELLRDGNARDAAPLIEQGAARRTDATVETLRAAVDALEGRTESAIKRLEALATRSGRTGRSKQHAALALAELYLGLAEAERAAGRRDRARAFLAHASSTVLNVVDSARAGLPPYVAVLGQCLDFLVDPEDAAAAFAGASDKLETLPRGARRRWLEWHCAVATLAAEQSGTLSACELALDILEESPLPPGDIADALAQAIAWAPTTGRKGDLEAEERATRLLERLLAMVESGAAAVGAAPEAAETARHWLRLSRARAARHRVAMTSASSTTQLERLLRVDPGDHLLALLRAEECLGAGDDAGAAEALRAAAEARGPGAAMCAQIASVLEEEPAAEPLAAPADAPPRLAAGLSLLRAVTAFASGDAEAGYGALFDAVRADGDATHEVVNFSRCLVPLVAQTRRGGALPPVLLDTLRQVAQSSSGNDRDTLTLARSAAAAGETDLAFELWRRSLEPDADPEAPERQELVAFLCHVAITAHGRRDAAAAARMLRQVAAVAAGESDLASVLDVTPPSSGKPARRAPSQPRAKSRRRR